MATEARRGRFTAVLVLVFTFVVGAAAGAGGFASMSRHGRGGRAGLERLPPPFEELDLSAEQRQQARVVFEKYRPQFEALFEENAPKVRALRDAMDAELVATLTPAQQTRFEELKKHRPERRRRGMGPPPDHD